MRTRARTAFLAAITAAATGLVQLPAASLATEHEEPPATFEPVLEAENFSITEQRQMIYDTPEYQAELAEQGVKNREEATQEQLGDSERNFSGDLCYEGENGCAGDVRLDHGGTNGSGRVTLVLVTARNAATIPGRIWSAVNPALTPNAKRPGIVIPNG